MDDNIWRGRDSSFSVAVETVVSCKGVEHFATVCEIGLDVEYVWVPVVM